MRFLLALVAAFQSWPEEWAPAPPPPRRERDGLVGAVFRVAEDHGGRRTETRTYDERGEIVTEVSFLRGHIMTRHYKPEGDRVLMCYEARSMVDSGPPQLAPRPVLRQGCGEAYVIRFEYGIKYERVNGVIKKVASALEEKALAGPELAWRTKYYYDARGRVTEAIGFSVLQAVVRRDVYTYRDDARAPETYEHQIDGRTRLKEWYEYKFDGRGNWVERRVRRREAPGTLGLPDVIRRAITYVTD